MIVSVSAVLLLGVFVFLIWRYARLPVWQAGVCILFGYYLAASSLGPYVAKVVGVLVRWIAGLHP